MLFFEIDSDISVAETLPAEAYRSQSLHEQLIERVLAPSWQWFGSASLLSEVGQAIPWSFLPGSVQEPLLLTRDTQEHLHCLSNTCTHRGSILLDQPCQGRFLRCPYHNRSFELNGKFRAMPGFEDVKNFPTERDSLPRVPFENWQGFLFAALQPSLKFADWIAPIQERLGWVPWKEFQFSQERSRDYLLKANWMLYVDNYLEGFHIPYVHPALAQVLDADTYEVMPLPWGVLQIGFASDPAVPVFDFPSFHPDAGQRVAAYYFWLFPNLMLNLYPWGLSVNIILPQAVDQTLVRYQTFLWKPEFLGQGAGADPGLVEQEDQQIIARVQAGIQSRLYHRGRYSPSQETGVHHFHRLLAQVLHA
ncbi:choline monooxygenase [bacterium (Candidatus Blackallbacteria) CG17_big_fil_post_rev_8_21_14_2_50_48_46]|uniref:Choline monooxygenase n=1 Tax=bacterium (Candidatus Blackallbacteria) CG17_big_fil_post_rev_8_21_14_2_50_48_46 TaxID=2014261 RepID=A0A2M7G3N0_9BACT|nr:MAG: choline monooxygenase [bacterium (Candidatus Blackallbacteria) CG18_big_fil_WC_8_21_14_2_50_49_26]PIW16476.1 MAG: choline monooxygenase [bacterium (Candidatus Blackallbacteria) CG17_big_fil_post_rev_8_21_14_2_50_48_46]PIW45984.1 MAG: choline monooxygenase [bacterium (Candidatus Blackallbacteria) CG13_big_fil_rev_8_21_14_2_50_49_14]